LVIGLAGPAKATTVNVYITADDPVLLINETTVLHILVEVPDGAPGNGVYFYALDVINDVSGIIGIESVDQLGEPAGWASDPGVITSDGLFDAYGGDGGYFANPNRGIGAPYEILTLGVRGLAVGNVTYTAQPATNMAEVLGIPSGFSLQDGEPDGVDFGLGVDLLVAPEPATLAPVFLIFIVLAGHHHRFRAKG
jgi:hypothetical protein